MEVIWSFILAIVQFILFYNKEIGISMFLFLTILNGTIYYILNKKNKIKNKNGLWLLVPIAILSSTYFVFANKTFYVANIFVITTLEILMFIVITNKKDYFKNYLYNALELLLDTITGYGNVIMYMKESLSSKNKKNREIDKDKLKKIVVSVIAVFSIALVVIMLLASADSIFANIFSEINSIFKNINIGNIFDFVLRVIIIVISYFLILGFIINIQEEYYREDKTKENCNKNFFMIKLLLFVLNIIYLVFCYIQIKSLFAKANIDKAFNYAAYARTGFFQLMIVSFINLVVILISKKYNENKEKLIRILNISLIIFTIIIAISAIYRMYMYETMYGLTYLRFFVYVILLTEIIAFVPIVISTFVKKLDFVKWCSIIVICMYCVINYMNIEKVIISKNINRVDNTIPIDYEYITNIASEDSYDILEGKLKEESISTLEKLELKNTLLKVSNKSKEMKWQEFNISKLKIQEKNIDTEELRREILKLEDKIVEEKRAIEMTSYENNSTKILYEKEFSNIVKIRVKDNGAVLGQKSLITIEKTNNGGDTWYNQVEMYDGCLTVNDGAKYVFLDENNGFINNLQTVVNNETQKGLLVTVDGGKTFEVAKFIKTDIIGDKYLYIEDVPYIENGELKVKTYTGYYNDYYEFCSNDKGKTWEMIK